MPSSQLRRSNMSPPHAAGTTYEAPERSCHLSDEGLGGKASYSRMPSSGQNLDVAKGI